MNTSNTNQGTVKSHRVLKNIDGRGVATVTLNNPSQHNAFDNLFIEELTSILNTLADNKNIRVVVLAAAGKNFCAGAELNWMKRMASFSHTENLNDAKALATMLHTLNTLPQPTIAKVQGAAFGGGVGLVSCCDIAVAKDDSVFSLSEVKLGLIPATISPYVIAAIGSRAARRYFTTAERFSSNTAVQIGLISEVANEDCFDKRINNIIDTLLSNGPQAVSSAKQLISAVENRPIDEKLIQETSSLIADIRGSAEAQEGLSAFLEKRLPSWAQTEQEA